MRRFAVLIALCVAVGAAAALTGCKKKVGTGGGEVAPDIKAKMQGIQDIQKQKSGAAKAEGSS